MKKSKGSTKIQKHLNVLCKYQPLIDRGDLMVVVSENGVSKTLKPMHIDGCISESKKVLRRGDKLVLRPVGCCLEFDLSDDPELALHEVNNLMHVPTSIVKRGGTKTCQYLFSLTDKSNVEKMIPELTEVLPNPPRLVTEFYSSNIQSQEYISLPIEKQVALGKTFHLCKFAYLFGINAWFEPVSLESTTNHALKLQKECMPNLIFEFCNRVANQIPCPIDYVFTPLIVILGSIIGHKIHLKPHPEKSMLVASLVWGIYIGESGTGKTPALEAVMVNLQLLIDRAREEHEKKHKNQQANNEVGKIEKSLELEGIRKGIRLAKEEHDDVEYDRLIQKSKQLMAKRNGELSATIMKRYKTSNTTLPALLSLLSQNPNGIAIVLDELKGFLARFSAKENEELRAFTLECARGFGSYDADRVSRNSISLTNMALSIVGGIQPDSFKPYLDRIMSSTSDNDGWIHRFLLITAPTPVETIDKNIKSPSKVVENAIKAIFLGVDSSTFGFDKFTKLEDRFVVFSDKAQKVHDQWVLDNFAKCARKSTTPLMKSHMRKYDSLLPAIALIYQTVMSLDRASLELKPFDTVSISALSQAIALLDYLEMHASRLFDKHVSVTVENAKTLLERLPTLSKMKFTAHELAWKEWAGMRRDTEAVTDALCLIEKHFYVRRVKQIKGKQGRSTTVWELNPLALTQS